MPRHLILTACLLAGFLCPPAHGQLPPNVPVRINIAGARRANVGQKTGLRVELLNQQGAQTAALDHTTVRLLATKHRDIGSARADVQPGEAKHRDWFELPADRNTVQTLVTIARGYAQIPVTFVSAQAGPIRIYAESEKYATGYTLIAVFSARASRADEGDIFVKAGFQDAPPAGLHLSIEGAGKGAVRGEKPGEWVHRFDVLLKSGEALAEARREITVRFIKQGPGVVEPASFVIPAGGYGNEELVLRVRNTGGGEVKVFAVSEGGGGPPVAQSKPVTFPFHKKVAAGLFVRPVPAWQPCSGRDAITILVSAVDEEREIVTSDDEGLAERRVELRLGDNSYGLSFDGGHGFLTLAGNLPSGERKIFGSRNVGTVVTALAKNKLGEDIEGFAEIGFHFPWWQLGFGVVGGASFPVARRLWRARQQKQRWGQALGGALVEACLGGMVGGVFFGFVFYGAVAITAMNWNGVPIILDRLPVQHSAFAALLIGVIGGVLIGSRAPLKSAIAGRLGGLREAPNA